LPSFTTGVVVVVSSVGGTFVSLNPSTLTVTWAGTPAVAEAGTSRQKSAITRNADREKIRV
jgi:hypothetical protein